MLRVIYLYINNKIITKIPKFKNLTLIVQKLHCRQKLSHENDRVDKNPPVKVTGQTNPSHENNRADKRPPVKMTWWTKALP
jgi:hypothetical protein